jgi:hypothetical protein
MKPASGDDQNGDGGQEAAFDERCEEEECRQLSGKLARESANKTGDRIGEILDRYETIVLELLAARYTGADGKRYSLATVLGVKYESDSALKEFLPKFAKWIGEYVSECIRKHIFGFTPLYRQIVPTHTWILCGHSVSRELLTALAEEYVRDREGLTRFLEAVLTHWRKIFEPHSLWLQRLLTHQLAGTPKEIANALEEIGAGPACTTPGQVESSHARVKQYCSRDRKKALEKRQKAR